MEREIYPNLPVKSLERSVAFFKKLGFEFNPQFTDNNGTMMMVNKSSAVMLLTEQFFQSFSKKPIGDAWKAAEVIMAISVGSNQEVDDLTAKVKEAGGKVVENYNEPVGMYGTRFEDLDGHLWELFYMDMKTMPQ